jgi:hypothetical protein
VRRLHYGILRQPGLNVVVNLKSGPWEVAVVHREGTRN